MKTAAFDLKNQKKWAKIVNGVFFLAKLLSRRSRLSRTTRDPSRLTRPRPINCNRVSEQPVKTFLVSGIQEKHGPYPGMRPRHQLKVGTLETRTMETGTSERANKASYAPEASTGGRGLAGGARVWSFALGRGGGPRERTPPRPLGTQGGRGLWPSGGLARPLAAEANFAS